MSAVSDRTRQQSSFKLCLLLLLWALVIAGCGRRGLDGLVPVSGTVTLHGKPVAGADVVFNPESGRHAASARTNAGGRYQLTTLHPRDGARPGKYVVTISKREVIDPLTAEQAREWFAKHPGPPPPSKVKNHVPDAYATAETSGLTATVDEGGANVLDFDLK